MTVTRHPICKDFLTLSLSDSAEGISVSQTTLIETVKWKFPALLIDLPANM